MQESYKIAILLTLINTGGVTHPFPLRKCATITSAAIAAYPMMYNAHQWSQNRKNRDTLIPTLQDVDPAVESHVRNQLRTRGYDNANTLPIKTYDDHFNMETQLDACLVFSNDYETIVKEALSVSSSDQKAQNTIGNLNIDLDHELFHIKDQHAHQSIRTQTCIPFIAEVALLPLTTKLIGIKNIAAFSAAIVGSIPLRLCMYKALSIVHRKSQEQAADNWAFQNNRNVADLTACMERRSGIVQRTFTGLYEEHALTGRSQSKMFNTLIRLFGVDITPLDKYLLDTDSRYAQKYFEDMKQMYEKFEQQPKQWPLRLLQYSFDPEHPFPLDSAKQIKKRINKLQYASSQT